MERQLSRQAIHTDSSDDDVEEVIESYLLQSGEVNALEQPELVYTGENLDDSLPPVSSNTLDSLSMLDSGATQHVTGNPDLIFNLRSCSVAPMLKAGGTSHRLYGKWFVLFRFPNGQIKSIEYVLYVPASSAIFSLLDVSLIKATP